MNNIANLRKERGLSQVELAELAKTTQPTIARIERGSDSVTLRMLQDIASALDVTIRDLFDNDRTQMEGVLISYFRNLSEERQQGWIDIARQELSNQAQKDE